MHVERHGFGACLYEGVDKSRVDGAGPFVRIVGDLEIFCGVSVDTDDDGFRGRLLHTSELEQEIESEIFLESPCDLGEA
ncbi:MAG: hypothetical protein JW395_2269 [Nitrospira sp.]|nr:hypothetical protein [Nitrospira sp.]